MAKTNRTISIDVELDELIRSSEINISDIINEFLLSYFNTTAPGQSSKQEIEQQLNAIIEIQKTKEAQWKILSARLDKINEIATAERERAIREKEVETQAKLDCGICRSPIPKSPYLYEGQNYHLDCFMRNKQKLTDKKK